MLVFSKDPENLQPRLVLSAVLPVLLNSKSYPFTVSSFAPCPLFITFASVARLQDLPTSSETHNQHRQHLVSERRHPRQHAERLRRPRLRLRLQLLYYPARPALALHPLRLTHPQRRRILIVFPSNSTRGAKTAGGSRAGRSRWADRVATQR